MLRVVLDTSVFGSSLLVRDGVPARILEAWRARRFLLVSSHTLIAEVRQTLSYPRIRRKYPVADEEVDALCVLIAQEAVLAPLVTSVADAPLRDPKDAHVLAAAAEAKAELLVTGDDDLLVLGAYHGTRILRPRELLQLLDIPTEEIRYDSPLLKLGGRPMYVHERPVEGYRLASPPAEEMGGEAPCQLHRVWDVED